LARALGIENISASQVSEINKGLQEQVDSFRSRPLEEEYPFLWIDALYDKVRVEDRVVTLALMTAHGVNAAGNREILAIEPMYDESEDSWRAFFRYSGSVAGAAGLRRAGSARVRGGLQPAPAASNAE
jgi:putative transposase